MADSTLTFSFTGTIPAGNSTPITLTLNSADMPAAKIAVQNVIKNGGFWCDTACYTNASGSRTLFFSSNGILGVEIT